MASWRRPRAPDLWTLVALAALFSLLVVALFGERLAPHEPIYFVVEHGADPRPYDPGVVFPFGSDVLGRDLLSLVLAGARTTLTIVLLGGLARVVAGVLVAMIGGWWRPVRIASEWLAELLSAVPATLVALVLVLVFAKGDRSAIVFIAALLVTGWAGPYRVVRAEVDRLARAPFTQGAVAMGVRRSRLFWRHHLPHLVPVIAVNLSQQVVAALVLVAELGVLSVFVGATRTVNIEESLSRVVTGQQNAAKIADPPEWGGLLANSRTIEALWTTRWLILVPGVAFALTAVAVAAIGFALARRYARRDLTRDVRSGGALALVLAVLALFIGSGLVPERFAAAREWAQAARAEVRPAGDIAGAFESAGLRPVASGYAVERRTGAIVQTGPGVATVGGATVAEGWPRAEDPAPGIPKPHVQAVVTGDTGGGVVEAPLVFVGRGITPAEIPPKPKSPYDPRPDLGTLIQGYADDYAGVDVRGKVVLVVRFLGVAPERRDPRTLNRYSFGPLVDEHITRAIARGAAAVLLVDPALHLYTDSERSSTYKLGELTGGINPYLRLAKELPAQRTGGVPVLVLDGPAAQQLLAPTGLDLSPFYVYDDPTPEKYRASPARELGITARVAVPLERRTASVTSYVGETPGIAHDDPRVLVWAIRWPGTPDLAGDVAAAVARAVGDRRAPLIFVGFDPSIDDKANARAVREVLKDRDIALVVVVDDLTGSALKFTTPNGELIPAFDLYAERAGARYVVTRTTPTVDALGGRAPFADVRTVLVTGTGGAGDVRADAAALIGYLAGRVALGAEEIPR